MKVVPVEHGLDLLASDLVRSPGLHASTVYGDLYRELEPKRYGRGGAPNPVMLMLGTAFEKHWEYLLLKAGVKAERPGEFVSLGGWALSPDLVIFNGHTAIGEMKLTWMSSRDMPRERTNGLPPKCGKYLMQIMDGCHAIETSHGRLYMCCVNGSGGFKAPDPEILVYDLEFTARELKESFATMVNHAHHKKML